MGKARPASSRLRFVPPFTPHIDSQQPASSDKTSSNCYDQVPGDDLVDSSQATWPEATSGQTGDHGNARRKAVKACRTAGGGARGGVERDHKGRYEPFLRAMQRVNAEVAAIRLRQQVFHTDCDKQGKRNRPTPPISDVIEDIDAPPVTSCVSRKLVSSRDQATRLQTLT